MSDVLKDLFAIAFLREPSNPFGAAVKVFGLDTGRALYASTHWVDDSYVLARQAELLGMFGEDYFLPNKAALARRVYELADKTTDAKEQTAVLKLYAEIRGFIEKQTAIANVVNNNTIVNQNRVMIVKDHGTDAQWEEKAAKQQTLLVEHART